MTFLYTFKKNTNLVDGSNSEITLCFHNQSFEIISFELTVRFKGISIGFSFIKKISDPFINRKVVRIELYKGFKTTESLLSVSQEKVAFCFFKVGFFIVRI